MRRLRRYIVVAPGRKGGLLGNVEIIEMRELTELVSLQHLKAVR